MKKVFILAILVLPSLVSLCQDKKSNSISSFAINTAYVLPNDSTQKPISLNELSGKTITIDINKKLITLEISSSQKSINMIVSQTETQDLKDKRKVIFYDCLETSGEHIVFELHEATVANPHWHVWLHAKNSLTIMEVIPSK